MKRRQTTRYGIMKKKKIIIKHTELQFQNTIISMHTYVILLLKPSEQTGQVLCCHFKLYRIAQ